MKVVELMGLPNAGKGSLITRAQKKLEEKGYSVQRIPDPGELFNFLNREISIERISWFFCQTLSQLLEFRNFSKADVVLVHRGVWDHVAFAKTLQLADKITKKEAERMSNYYQIFANKEDKIVLVMIPPRVSFERGKIHSEEDISSYHNQIVNLKFLQLLEKAYQEITLSLKEKEITVLDGTKSIEENLDLLLTEITSLLPSALK